MYTAKDLAKYLHKVANNQELFINAGIFVNNIDEYDEYFENLIESIKKTDYLLQWNSTDKYLFKKHFKKNKTFKSFNGLEPFLFEEKGWHYSLKDKKVLCVSPFSKSVKTQSQIFGKIWYGAEIGCVETVSVPHSEALTGEKPVSWKIKFANICLRFWGAFWGDLGRIVGDVLEGFSYCLGGFEGGF